MRGNNSPSLNALLLVAGVACLSTGIASALSEPAAPNREGSSPMETEKPRDDDRPYYRTNLFRRLLHDQEYLVTEWWPDEFRRPAFAVPLLVTTAAALSYQSREEEGFGDAVVGSSADDGSHGPSTGIASAFTGLGNGPPAVALLTITYFASRHMRDHRLAEASSLSIESLINAGLWSEVVKRSLARVRPSQPNEGKFFQYGATESTSFPSGHAMGAFAVAAAFADEYHGKRWVPWVAYGTATLIGGSRLALGRHFPTDVVVGAILGSSIGHGVGARARSADSKRAEPWTRRLTPIVDPASAGYGIAYSDAW